MWMEFIQRLAQSRTGRDRPEFKGDLLALELPAFQDDIRFGVFDEKDSYRFSRAVRTCCRLVHDPSLAAAIGKRLFPPEEAALIGTLIERDAPFYDATISSEAIDGLNKFAKAAGLISETVPYDRLVATQFRQLWR